MVDRQKTRDQGIWPPFRPRKKWPKLYEQETPIIVKAGSLFIFQMGTFHRASSSSSLSAVYSSIAAALRHTWRVSYLTAASPGDPIRLQAAVAGADHDSD